MILPAGMRRSKDVHWGHGGGGGYGIGSKKVFLCFVHDLDPPNCAHVQTSVTISCYTCLLVVLISLPASRI